MTVLRRALDALYTLAAWLAALSLGSIFLLMMAQVAMREMNMLLPGADDIIAYLCVSTTFFALARTFKNGELIRVGLFIDRAGPGLRRMIEIGVLGFAALVVGAITWFTLEDVLFSIEIEEVAQGSVAFPTWVPKSAMPLGAGILLIAVIEELVRVIGRETPAYVQAAADRAARGDFSAEV
jgi:TRAP-type C4-dicarboxylate transport system permease small subunit